MRNQINLEQGINMLAVEILELLSVYPDEFTTEKVEQSIKSNISLLS